MNLFLTSLASGSNGNCYYIGNEKEAILVDAGISCREIEKRMKRLHLSMQKIKAIFISHEHSDHIRGLIVLSRKFNLPVYGTSATLLQCQVHLDDPLARPFGLNDSVTIGSLTVSSFPKFHDAVEPCSFIVSYSGINVGVFTDIGLPCAHVIRNFAQCHAVFLETNYDDALLDAGNYPFYLKKRIRSDHGHLSNIQALQLFKEHRSADLSHLFLSHLSKNNNCPTLVQELFNLHAGSTKIILASRFEETAVYKISARSSAPKLSNHRNSSVEQLQFQF